MQKLVFFFQAEDGIRDIGVTGVQTCALPISKKITGYVKLQVPAGKANPSPPIGPALGQRGVNIMEFCKAFNAQTGDMETGMPIPTVITVYADRSFSFEMKTPPATYFLKKAAKITSGSKEPGKQTAGRVKRSQ